MLLILLGQDSHRTFVLFLCCRKRLLNIFLSQIDSPNKKIAKQSKFSPHKRKQKRKMTTTNATTKVTPLFQSQLEILGIMFLRFPYALRFWIGILLLANMGGLLFFPGSVETQVIAGSVMIGTVIMSYLYSRYGGFTRLLGLGHVHWPVLVIWLYVRLSTIDDPTLQKWVVFVIVVDSISLILDFKDVMKYFDGQKEATMVWDISSKQD